MHQLTTVVALLVAVPLVADAKPKAQVHRKQSKAKQAAKAHMNRATRAHKAGKFDVALTELQAAYAIDPQTKLLFAIAQVQQKLDRCDEAIPSYEKFLTSVADKQKRAVVEQAIDACKAKLAAAPAPPAEAAQPDGTSVFRDSKPAEQPPPPPSEPAAPIPPPAPPPAPPPRVEDDAPTTRIVDTPVRRSTPWYKDVLGDTLVLGGVASAVVSGIFYRNARADLDAAESADSIETYERLVDRAYDRRTIAVVLAGGGAVLVGAGLLRYALRDNGEAHGIALVPVRDGGLVTWSGGF